MTAPALPKKGRRGQARAPRVLLIDNYDSFTFNLLQRLGELGAQVEVIRNDAMTTADLINDPPERLVISPGPCTPNEAGISVAAIRALSGRIPILGVCLGHQTIGAAFGGEVVRAPAPVHGKAEEVLHDGEGLFKGAPQPLWAGRYHSLVVKASTLPPELRVTAKTRSGIIMALQHRTLPTYGLQFHPESILTPDGQVLLRNFLAVPA